MTSISNTTSPIEQQISDLSSAPLPRKYTRDIHKRIFVNRTVNMSRIQYVGFDMDYTLAVYSQEFEHLCYGLCLNKLVQTKGYPKELIEHLKYDPAFPIRGLFLDKRYGNMLKVDQFGYILKCIHGHKNLMQGDLYQSRFKKEYPDKLIHPDEIGKRFYSFDTLFGLPEIQLYCDLVDWFESRPVSGASSPASASERAAQADAVGTDAAAGTGASRIGEEDTEAAHGTELSFQSLFEDVRESMHLIHIDGQIKNAVLRDPAKHILRNPQMAIMLHRLRASGRKIFLMTNSEYYYTKHVMSYLLDGQAPAEITAQGHTYGSWTDYFDIIITDAKKPLFFDAGSTLREVDQTTGTLKFFTTQTKQGFQKGTIYSGGSLKIFKEFTNTGGSEVLYCGDNVYHDIIYSKKVRCLWRTLLVVRELESEVTAWQNEHQLYNKLEQLEYLRAQAYKGLDSSSPATTRSSSSEMKDLRFAIRRTSEELDNKFNSRFGSLFRTGGNESFFSSQCRRFADLYSSDYCNLLHYPFDYYFSALPQLQAHERAAVDEEQ